MPTGAGGCAASLSRFSVFYLVVVPLSAPWVGGGLKIFGSTVFCRPPTAQAKPPLGYVPLWMKKREKKIIYYMYLKYNHYHPPVDA